MLKRKLLKPKYLGDGIYAHDNGCTIELAVNHHKNIAVNHHKNKVIVMENFVIKAFIKYCKESGFIKELK